MTAVAYLLTSELHQLKVERVFRDVEYVIGGVVVAIVIGEHLLRKAIRRAAKINEEPPESVGMLFGGEEAETNTDNKKPAA